MGAVRSLDAVAHELEAKVPRFPNAANATVGRRIFVRKKGKQSPVGTTVHDLESFLE
jgi:hypothetical protein